MMKGWSQNWARLNASISQATRQFTTAVTAPSRRNGLFPRCSRRRDFRWVREFSTSAQARALFEAAGVREPFHPGARTEEEVDAFLAQHGARPITQIPCESDAPVTMREFLRRIESGECSYTWKLPPSLQTSCVAALLEWAQVRFNLDRPIASDTAWKIFLLSE
jgi:hypothetical protein